MTEYFVEMVDGKLCNELTKRGTKGFGRLSPDSTYIDKGFYPFKDSKPAPNKMFENTVKVSMVLVDGYAMREYTRSDISLSDAKTIAITTVNAHTEKTILKIASRDKQLNMQSRYLTLLNLKISGDDSVSEELADIGQILGSILDIIEAGNLMCTNILAMDGLEDIRSTVLAIPR